MPADRNKTEMILTKRYPFFQPYSGISKFIPYHPTIRVRGRKIVVTTVKIFIVVFRLISTSAS